MLCKCLLKNASQIVQITNDSTIKIKKGKEQNEIEIIKNGSMIIDLNGKIKFIGTNEQLENYLKEHENIKFEKEIDCSGKSIIPGLVDSHTHPVWNGDRCHEFVMKLQGATYMQIHQMGGGIGFTVRHTRQSTIDELFELLIKRLKTMITNGTTLVEGKSGYGLETETEIKMLQVLHKANQQNISLKIPEIVSTYLGAHSVPKDKKLDEYTNEIINQQIPAIKEAMEKGLIGPSLIDVFHEKGVFETEETKRVLLEGKNKLGLNINFHGDELNPMKSAELSYELDALAVSHCEHISDEGIKCMAEKSICATLLPTTAYILRIEYPPARKMIDNGVPVVLATDFNPNAHCMSLPFVMNLSCVNMRMTLNEALVATTLNAAASIGKSDTHGSLHVGKVGDC
ncbi:hypothetical protein ABK040_001147 [Willaertia magna]